MPSRRFLLDVVNAAALGTIVGWSIKSVIADGFPLWRLIAVTASAAFTVWAYRRYRRRQAGQEAGR